MDICTAFCETCEFSMSSPYAPDHDPSKVGILAAFGAAHAAANPGHVLTYLRDSEDSDVVWEAMVEHREQEAAEAHAAELRDHLAKRQRQRDIVIPGPEHRQHRPSQPPTDSLTIGHPSRSAARR